MLTVVAPGTCEYVREFLEVMKNGVGRVLVCAGFALRDCHVFVIQKANSWKRKTPR